MKLQWITRASVLVIALGMAGCTTIKSPQPKTSDFKAAPPKSLSTLAVPVRIPAPFIEQIISEQLPADVDLYAKEGLSVADNTDVKIRIQRSGPISVSTDSGCMNLSMQLVIVEGRVDWRKNVFGFIVRKTGSFGGSAKIKARVCPSLSPDWRLSATVQPSFDWIEGAYLNVNVGFANFNIGIAEKMTPVVQGRLDAIAGQIQSKIAQINVKGGLEKAWAAIDKPILLAKKVEAVSAPEAAAAATAPSPGASAAPVQVKPAIPEIYLLAEPKTIGMGPLVTEGNEIVGMPIISAYLSVNLGKPDLSVASPPSPLPNNSGPIASPGVNISLVAKAPYEEINKYAETALKAEPIELGAKKTVKVTGLNILPDGEHIVVKVGFTAELGWLPFDNVKGELYLRGKPRYSNETRTVWVEDLKFDAETNKLLVGQAAALLANVFNKTIEKALHFDVSRQVDPVIEKMNEGVAGHKIVDGVLLNAKASTVELSYIHVGPNSLSVQLNVKGEANVVAGAITK